MNKAIKIFTAFIIMLIALPLGANIVKADEKGLNIGEGEYKVDFVILNENKKDVSSMNNYIEKDYADLSIDEKGKKTVAIYIENNEMIQNFKVNGVEKWNEKVNEEIRKIAFPVEEIEQLQKGEVTIDTGDFGPGIMVHTVYLKFTLKEDVEDPKEDPNEKPRENQVELNKSNPVKKGETITVKKGQKNFQLKMPSDLPENVALTIKPVKNADVKTKGNIEIAGQVYEFDFDGLGSYKGKFELVMNYDAKKYDSDQVDIYYFDEKKEQWIPQNGEVKDGKVTVTVDHFSTYGVFADASETGLLKPDKAFEIDYTILHEDGSQPSLSNDFFKKPALLFEKGGNKYVHLTIENGDMIRWLSNKFGNALIVDENDDGSKVIQLRVNDDLSDMLLDMHIVVPAGAIPGFPGYDSQHKALLVFDKDSVKEIDVANHMLIGTNNPNNKNGIYLEGGSSNELSESDDTEETTSEPVNANPDKDLNPKTGDTNNIGFYIFLLISSLISLGFLVRKRRFN